MSKLARLLKFLHKDFKSASYSQSLICCCFADWPYVHLSSFSMAEGHDQWFWYVVSVVGTTIGFPPALAQREYSVFAMFIVCICVYIYFGLLLCSFVIHRHVQQKCIGNLGKLVVDVITMSAAMPLRQLLGFDLCALCALVGFTIDLHTVAQSLHIAYDVSIWDIMLGSIMQIVVYLMWENKYMVTVVLMFGGVTLYRYASYSPPVMPVDTQQLKQLC